MDSNGDGFERCEALESCPVKGLKCAQRCLRQKKVRKDTEGRLCKDAQGTECTKILKEECAKMLKERCAKKRMVKKK
jgi:hypothetical protein